MGREWDARVVACWQSTGDVAAVAGYLGLEVATVVAVVADAEHCETGRIVA